MFGIDPHDKEVTGMRRKKGFTFIEMIIILAIIGVLGAILIPSVAGYVTLSRKKATVENGRTIYMAAMLALENEDAYESFYTPQSSWVAFESTADGCVLNTTTVYKGVASTYSERITNLKRPLAQEGNYRFTIVARVDGHTHKTGSDWKNPSDITHVFRTWNYSDKRYATFVKEMCAELDMKMGQQKGNNFQVKMPYTKREDGGSLPLVRWLIVYRLDDPSQVEVWAGDGYKSENGPAYRVYPDPASNYK